MSIRKNAEYYILKMKEVLQSNLNTKIIEINNLENDGLTLDQINNNAYYYLTVGQKVPSYNIIVVLGFDVIVNGQLGYSMGETLNISIEMIISNKIVADSDILVKMIDRYRRAIINTLLENYRSFPEMNIEALPNAQFTLKNDGALYHALGYILQCSYAY